MDAPEQVGVRVRTIGLVPCAYPCHPEKNDGYLVTEPGLYPDLLSDMTEFGFPMICGQWRSLWIDLEIKKGAKAGAYPVKMRLEYQGNEEAGAENAGNTESAEDAGNVENTGSVEIAENAERAENTEIVLEILDAELPGLSIPHTEWFHCDCLANYYNVKVFSEEH